MNNEVANGASPWRSVGVWMSVLIAALMALNTWRAYSDPAGFAAYFGIEGAADGNPAFVYVYASRALFLAAVAVTLIATQQFRALGYFALVAIIMPATDAALVMQAGGAPAIIARHAATAVYLGLTAYLLHRWVNKHG
jgi:Na+-transporting methylmalonyl-CoA/oxaloacetate decarboxylase beta subunit